MRRPGLGAATHRLLVLAASALVLAGLAAAQAVTLQRLAPTGAQRGTTVELELRGRALGGAQALVFDRPGLVATEVRSEDQKRVFARVEVAPDAPLGPHPVRIRTARGISGLLTFHVGSLPVVEEVEPNPDTAGAQPLPLGVTVHGTLSGEDEDVFAFRAPEGTRVRAVVEALRLGTVGLDPLVELLDADGEVLARGDDSALTRRDSIVQGVIASGNGVCYVRLRDAARGARRGAAYRLHVDAGAQPLGATPLSVPQDSASAAGRRMLLGPDGPLASTTAWARDLETGSSAAPAGTAAWWPDESLAPLVLRVSTLETLGEVEPNNRRSEPRVLPAIGDAGIAVDGALASPGDRDHFEVQLEKGQKIRVAVWARRLRSPLDAALAVRGPDGRTSYADDDAGLDPVEEVSAKEAGKYTITVSEHLGRGGPAHLYRLEVTPILPSVSARLAGERKELAVPRGRRAYALLALEREDLGGPLRVDLEDLPPGVTARPVSEGATGDAALVLLEAGAEAPLGAAPARVALRRPGDDATLGGLSEMLTLVEGRNNSVLQGHMQTRVPVAVTEAVPFDVAAEPVAAPLVRSGRQDVRVRIVREEGFTAPVVVGLTGLPNGVRVDSSKRLEGDALEATFTLEAAGDAGLGQAQVVAWAEAPIEGVGVRLASEPVPLNVVGPVLALEAKRGMVERGSEGVLAVKLTRNEGAPGGAFGVSLVGLPHDVVSEALVLEPGTEELRFPLKVGPKAPKGKHRGLAVQARIAVGEGTILQTLGGLELRVQPRAAPPGGAPGGAPVAVEESASRLDRLRAEHAARVAGERAQPGEPGEPATVPAGGEEPPKATAPPAASEGGDGQPLAAARRPRARLASDLTAMEVDAPPSFLNDVIPILTANGCNVGACHGASRGQDGFHLSLFGYDAAGDHGRLMRERIGRRIDLAFPEESLLLTKATGAVPHTGGKLLEPDGEDYQVLLRWIRGGAISDLDSAPRVVGLTLEPESLVLAPGEGAALRAIARYSDGEVRDVTGLALMRTDDATVASLERDGTVRTGGPGEAFLTAAFATETVGVPVIVRSTPADAPWRDPAEGMAPASWIDELLEQKLRAVGAEPAPLCTDAEFIRRASLDLTGLPPTPAALGAFVADGRPLAEKRAALVDELVRSPDFIDQWVMRFAELLRIRSTREVSPKAAQAWFEWLAERLHSGARIDAVVREQLTAKGDNFAVPEASYFLAERDPGPMAENVAQSLLGVRISCAQCHNHPFDRWTQDDYAGFVAFFSEVRSKGAEDPDERTVSDRRGRGFRHPTTKAVVEPRFLGGEAPELGRRLRRDAVAEWITSPDNPWFARNVANRVWAAYMGRGVVEPVDDVRVTNPPSSQELLDALAARLVSSGFDLGDLAREIILSRAYQRTSATRVPDGDDLRDWDRDNFAAFRVRRLRAETLSDSLAAITGVDEDLPRLAPGVRATQLADGADASYFLRAFGRAPRETVCACEVSDSPSLSQALHLVNGATVHAKVTRGTVIKELIAAGLDDGAAVEALYERALCRRPSPDERDAVLLALADAGEDRQAGLEDVFWALLTSNEFLFQR